MFIYFALQHCVGSVMSKDEKLSESALDNARTHARLSIIGEVSKLYERLLSEGVVNQSRIAERLGVSRQHISQLLSGPGGNNWTLNKVGELLAAMDAAITRIEMKPTSEISPSNEYHAWLEPKIAIERLQTKAAGSKEQVESKPLMVTERPSTPRLRKVLLNGHVATDVTSATP
jgi:transcriptional regulator with XRE-family HTH domain